MNIVQIRWIVVGSLALGLSACDVQVGKCERDDAGDCVDLFPDDEDAGDEEDAGELDGGRDAGHGDGGRSDGAAVDGGADDGGAIGAPLSLREFCEAALSPGQPWADKLDECCSSSALGSEERKRLLAFFGFPAGGASDCEDRNQVLIERGDVTFDGKYAAECAAAIASNYASAAPPAECPAGDGFFLPEIEAQVGHGAQVTAQIAACRKTFVGSLSASDICTSDLHCSGMQVCRPGSGAQTCQDAVPEGGSCDEAADCTAGTTCKGNDSTAGGKRCTAVDDLGLNGANCTRSAECLEGLICDANSLTCVAPPTVSDFKPSGVTCAELECRGFCDETTDRCSSFCAQ